MAGRKFTEDDAMEISAILHEVSATLESCGAARLCAPAKALGRLMATLAEDVKRVAYEHATAEGQLREIDENLRGVQELLFAFNTSDVELMEMDASARLVRIGRNHVERMLAEPEAVAA